MSAPLKLYDRLLAQEQERTKQKLDLMNRILRGEMKPARRMPQIQSWLGKNRADILPFDPASLTLTGWWRASFGGAPWGPTASAGTSGSNGNLAGGGGAATGSAVNGFTPADLNGTSQYLDSAVGATTLLQNAAPFSMAILFSADTVPVDTTANTNRGLFCSAGGYGGATVMSQGGVPKVYLHTYNGAHAYASTTTFALSTWTLVQIKTGGSTVNLRVNGGARTTSGAVSPQYSGSVMQLGAAVSGSRFDGQVLEVMTSQTDMADADEDGVLDYMRSRYGLSLS